MKKVFGFGLMISLLGYAQAADARPPFRVLSDVSYLAPNRSEKLDLYLPAQVAGGGPRAAMVIVHGGGWTVGDKADARERAIAEAYARAGFVCANINYRLGARAWPTNLQDCKMAVRFLRSHAEEYHIDPACIGVHGNSAGGHLALLVGFTANQPAYEPQDLAAGVSSAVSAVVDFYGRADPATCVLPAPDGTPTSKVCFTPGLEEMLGASLQQDPRRWQAASPMAQATPRSPPVLIVQGLSDPSVDYTQAVRLANVLRADGVVHELVLLEGIGHGFDLNSWKGRPMRDLEPAVLSFLERCWKHPVRQNDEASGGRNNLDHRD